MVMPRADIIMCKHCGKPLGMIPRETIVARFKLACVYCKGIFSVYPEQRGENDATMPRMEPAHA